MAGAAKRAYDNWSRDENGCYISTYSVQSSGYAQVGWWEDGKSHMTTAHRAAWIYAHGEIEGRMDVDHRDSCDRRCVNVEHLRLLTPQQNRRRKDCGHGEDSRVPRIVPGKKPMTICLTCRRMSAKASRERRKVAF